MLIASRMVLNSRIAGLRHGIRQADLQLSKSLSAAQIWSSSTGDCSSSASPSSLAAASISSSEARGLGAWGLAGTLHQ